MFDETKQSSQIRGLEMLIESLNRVVDLGNQKAYNLLIEVRECVNKIKRGEQVSQKEINSFVEKTAKEARPEVFEH